MNFTTGMWFVTLGFFGFFGWVLIGIEKKLGKLIELLGKNLLTPKM
jgi:hypothetical protein